MKIGIISKELGIPVPTIRRWTIEFGSALSKEAQGVNGAPREFSAKDLRVLRRVKELLDNPDKTYKYVRIQIREEGYFSASGERDERNDEPSPTEKEAVNRYILKVFDDAIRPYIETINALQQKVEELQREVQRLKELAGENNHYSVEEDKQKRVWRFTLW